MRDKKKINIEANKTFGDFITVGDLHLARGKGVKGTISNHPSVSIVYFVPAARHASCTGII